MSNHQKLQALLLDILLITPQEYSVELRREDVETWDSLAVVSIGVGLQEVFGYHPTPDEAVALDGVHEIIKLLESKGIPFDA